MPERSPALLADIGGTNARFALENAAGRVGAVHTLATADYPSLAAAARAFLATLPGRPPQRAAIAVAAPVVGDRVRLTNRRWSFSTTALARSLGLEHLAVVNDFVAVALAIPALRPGDWRAVGGGRARPDAPIAVLGPGTGLGVAALVPGGDRGGGWIPVATEGGHATLAARTAAEARVLARLARRHGHVSAERVLSGPGLVALYRALGPQRTRTAPTPAAITEAALAGTDPRAAAAVALFCDFLGGFAGNLALTYGALGGVYIAGGVAPRITQAIAASRFRARFEDKGRFRPYLAAIPTRIVTRADPAFLGLAALAARMERPRRSP